MCLPYQINLAGNSDKSDDISAKKKEAVDQCPGWNAFSVYGSYATDDERSQILTRTDEAHRLSGNECRIEEV